MKTSSATARLYADIFFPLGAHALLS
uniref:Uncharacterized protein n=1 Tax=Anguilla anguilla TaxID=7936 RepID=A0A0E9XWS6_ANGAN